MGRPSSASCEATAGCASGGTTAGPNLESAPGVRYHSPLASDPHQWEFALEFCALASGSKGNAVFVGADAQGVLVDVGLPGRQIEARLRAVGVETSRVTAVVVTHEHRDHVAGVGVWARRHGVPVYMTEMCRRAVLHATGTRELGGVEMREFEPGETFEVAGLEFLPVSTSHDAADSVGFRISDGSTVFGLATDLGFASHLVRHTLKDAHLLFLESNHDEDLLISGPYPWFLKQRIRSRHGHLSNEACADLVADLLHRGLQAVVLGHLSATNNQPTLAYESTRRVLLEGGAAEDVTLLVARQDRPGRVVKVAGQGIRILK